MLIILFFIVYTALSVWRLDAAVMLLIFGLPAYLVRFHVFGVPSTLLEGMILIAFAVFAIKNYQQIYERIKYRLKYRLNPQSAIRNPQFERYPFDVEIILLLIISWAAIIVAGCTSSAFGIWKAYFFEPILVFILVFNTRNNNANLRINANMANSNYADGNDANMRMTRMPRILDDADGNDANMRILRMPRILDDGDGWRQIENILWALGLSAFMVSVWAVLQRLGVVFSPENFWPRVTGPFPYPNALGLYLGPIVLIMMGWALKIFNFQFSIFKQSSIFKVLFIFSTIIISLFAIYLARSEGAMVGIGAAVLFLSSFFVCDKIFKLFKRPSVSPKINLIKIFIIMALSCVYPLIALNVYPQNYYPNFSNKYLNFALNKIMLKDLSGEIRKQQWRETWQMLTASPQRFLFGAGLDGFQAAVAPYHQEGIFYNFEHDPDFRRKIVWFNEKYKAEHWQPVEVYMYPHSIFLNFWSELGLAGALLFVWIIGKYIWIGIKYNANDNNANLRINANMANSNYANGNDANMRMTRMPRILDDANDNNANLRINANMANSNYANGNDANMRIARIYNEANDNNANLRINANMANSNYANGNDANMRMTRIYNEVNKYFVLGLIGAMIVIVVHGLVDVPYFKNDLAVGFWVLLALAGSIKIKSKKN